jgi:uncharacterized protein GlcG (DUF336 family)
MPRTLETLTLADAKQILEAGEAKAASLGTVGIFGGGLPVKVDDQIVGAVGTSAGSVEQDIAVAEAAAAILRRSAETP